MTQYYRKDVVIINSRNLKKGVHIGKRTLSLFLSALLCLQPLTVYADSDVEPIEAEKTIDEELESEYDNVEISDDETITEETEVIETENVEKIVTQEDNTIEETNDSEIVESEILEKIEINESINENENINSDMNLIEENNNSEITEIDEDELKIKAFINFVNNIPSEVTEDNVEYVGEQVNIALDMYEELVDLRLDNRDEVKRTLNKVYELYEKIDIYYDSLNFTTNLSNVIHHIYMPAGTTTTINIGKPYYYVSGTRRNPKYERDGYFTISNYEWLNYGDENIITLNETKKDGNSSIGDTLVVSISSNEKVQIGSTTEMEITYTYGWAKDIQTEKIIIEIIKPNELELYVNKTETIPVLGNTDLGTFNHIINPISQEIVTTYNDNISIENITYNDNISIENITNNGYNVIGLKSGLTFSEYQYRYENAIKTAQNYTSNDYDVVQTIYVDITKITILEEHTHIFVNGICTKCGEESPFYTVWYKKGSPKGFLLQEYGDEGCRLGTNTPKYPYQVSDKNGYHFIGWKLTSCTPNKDEIQEFVNAEDANANNEIIYEAQWIKIPTISELANILNEKSVKVQCISENPHEDKLYSVWNENLDDNYKPLIENIYTQNGNYYCDVTLYGELYCDMYKSKPSVGVGILHKLSNEETQIITLKWNRNTEKWESEESQTILATFNVEHEGPTTANYKIKWYDENNELIKATEWRSDTIGNEINVMDYDKVISGYIFDSENENNILTEILEPYGTELKLYFKKEQVKTIPVVLYVAFYLNDENGNRTKVSRDNIPANYRLELNYIDVNGEHNIILPISDITYNDEEKMFICKPFDVYIKDIIGEKININITQKNYLIGGDDDIIYNHTYTVDAGNTANGSGLIKVSRSSYGISANIYNYYNIHTENRNLLKISWYDEDSNLLETNMFDVNEEEPTYSKELPTKESDSKYDYVFKEWVKQDTPLNDDDISYVASYTAIPKESHYTITHEYYTDGKLDGFERNSENDAEVDNIISEVDIERNNLYDGNVYKYVSTTPSILQIQPMPATNEFVLRYERYSYKVIHKYLNEDGDLDGEAEEVFYALEDDEIDVSTKQQPLYNDELYPYKEDSGNLIISSNKNSNVITITYQKEKQLPKETSYLIKWMDTDENELKSEVRKGFIDDIKTPLEYDYKLDGYTFVETQDNILSISLNEDESENVLKLYFEKDKPIVSEEPIVSESPSPSPSNKPDVSEEPSESPKPSNTPTVSEKPSSTPVVSNTPSSTKPNVESTPIETPTPSVVPSTVEIPPTEVSKTSVPKKETETTTIKDSDMPLSATPTKTADELDFWIVLSISTFGLLLFLYNRKKH